MQRVPLTKVPRQELSVPLDGAYWRIKFYLSLSHVCADIERNGSDLIKGVRCFVGVPLLPYQHLRSPNFGNFYFDNDVDWQTLDDECVLYYLNEQQVRELDESVKLNNWNTVFKSIAAEAEAFRLYEEKVSVNQYPRVKITVQPQQVEVLLARPATLMIKADNAISYQWEFAKQESGVAWKTVEGQKANVLTFNSVSEEQFGYYRCIAIGLDSIEISDNAWLKQTKLPMPSFTRNLQKSADFKSGNPLILSVFSPEAYSYQWQYSKNSTGPWTDIAGQTSERLNIASSSTQNDGYYRTVAYGSNGMGAPSDVCFVKVWDAIWLPGLNNNITVKVGDKVSMSWSGGQNIVNYDMFKESEPNKILQSGTNSVFEIASYKAEDAGTYKSRLSNPVQSVVSQRSYTLTTYVPGPPIQISNGIGYIIGTSVPVEYQQLIKEADSASNVRILYEFITLPNNEALDFWDVSSEFTITKSFDSPTQADRWKFSRSIVGIPVKNLIRYSDPSSDKWTPDGLVTAQRDATNKLAKLTFTGDGTYKLNSFDNDPTIDKVPVGTDCVLSVSLFLQAGSFDVSIPNSQAQVWGYVGDGTSKQGQWVRFKIPFKMIGYPSIVASGSEGSIFSIKDVQIDARPIAMPIQRTNGPVTATNVKSENLLTYSRPDPVSTPSQYVLNGNSTISNYDAETVTISTTTAWSGIDVKISSLYAEEYTVSFDLEPLTGTAFYQITALPDNKAIESKFAIPAGKTRHVIPFISGSSATGTVNIRIGSSAANGSFRLGNVQVERNPFQTRLLRTTGTTRSEVTYASGEMQVKYSNAYGEIDGTGSIVASIPPGQ